VRKGGLAIEFFGVGGGWGGSSGGCVFGTGGGRGWGGRGGGGRSGSGELFGWGGWVGIGGGEGRTDAVGQGGGGARLRGEGVDGWWGFGDRQVG